ncbi:hypothetical protein AJ85_12500 [Alkalihalobacillus alcalophilus ATCC 27647 = CGMCC 1.3604]|uniref:UPF0435 protein AJ85_12500 n=1 Tax=Alkalihalobacillus alcalophilus ATCC 27647 = CGMCC 1.3604 TaxID=1218173 RepID=A0A094XG44_ALKAL|nr:DUF1128 domain-containing protein [Alkalihalobacillus alcalophilus]KGA97725.1 hypothetical protein BALCAV_0208275 [Alkalihalobacillus alcalophilus ATCC 27647 = CGMCC 1.3604]MED1563170.1 DUF1128 domain-containing protein [Alkalihalobacillus alcalophilus]THG90145.1 hypothetical protein AJ85_12500 [Alkalihalobacillus alcalophilus ATCC 27647 = CGMCC 1.3604]
MDLTVNNRENIEYMIEAIKDKLQFVNSGAINAKNFNTSKYEELVEIYEMIMRKSSFSVSELDAIASELGNLRD